MATLVSPGVSVTVTDESNYAPNQLGSVAYILVASATNKVAPGGTAYAAGTLPENAGKVYNITSQRDLVTTFGTPSFYTTSGGAPINGDERNEYGLLAAYSLLGVSNTVYVQRANVDLAALGGTTSRPLADPASGAFWLDTTMTDWGIYEWSSSIQDFNLKTPIVIMANTDLATDNFTPNTALGSIGSYAVNTYSNANPIFTKVYDNSWKLLGSTAWQASIPAITSSNASAVIQANAGIIINTVNVAVGINANLSTVAANINAANITGITSRVANNLLVISVTDLAKSANITADGRANISNGGAGTALATIGITAGSYTAPNLSITPYYSVPSWQGTTGDGVQRPSGSVWQKASALGMGLNAVIKKYDRTIDAWAIQSVPDYSNLFNATFGLDPTGGGLNIAQGTIFTQYNGYGNVTASEVFYYKNSTGATTVTGSTTTPTAPRVGATFTLTTRANASLSTTTSYSGNVTTGTVQGFLNAISALGDTNISANLDASGRVVITHALGGDMIVADGTGTPFANVGINLNATNVYASPYSGSANLLLTNWKPLDNVTSTGYYRSSTQPYVEPANNTLWYYNTPSRADIMISNGSAWLGYQNLTNDIRGYNLSNTNSTGPILSTSTPTLQDDGTPLVYGDLWLNTADLENYPKLYRWQRVTGVDQWVLINNTDNTSQNGILFADARWSTAGNVNPVTGTIPSIATLAASNYVDLDAPDPTLYPRGMLLFNTRASGYNVKEYKSSYFTSSAYPNQSIPSRADIWVSVSGYQSNGVVPNFGRKAQRGVTLAALRSAIDSSTALREDANQFNLIACPGYPELIPNMVTLNEDRDNTAFIVGDTPMRLAGTGTDIQNWAQNTNGTTSTGEDGLATVNPYVGVYYPSGQTNDLGGNPVVVPPSHAVLRSIIKSDNISYPWLAPAGTRRGLVDNVNSIGYINYTSGAFVSIGVTQGLRDVMYTNKINPLTNLPGTGLVIYGQKTLSSTPSSLDRINVARLINYLRTQMNTLARPFIFEPNDPITRNGVKSVVSSLLNDLVAKRGITDYVVVCDTTNNTPERIARNELWVDVAVQPTKDVEFIYIPIRLKNPGDLQAGNLASATAVGTGA
jgi:hypothetical protein